MKNKCFLNPDFLHTSGIVFFITIINLAVSSVLHSELCRVVRIQDTNDFVFNFNLIMFLYIKCRDGITPLSCITS